MTGSRPTVSQERWLAVAARYPSLRAAADTPLRTGGWRTTSMLSRCLFFALGLAGASLVGGAVALLPEPALVAGVLLIAAGEWLVRKRRVIHSGLEEALWLTGAAALGFELAANVRDIDAAILVVLACTTVSAVGVRLLNPLFIAAGIACAPIAFLAAVTGGDWRQGAMAAGVASAALAIAALLAGSRRWRRPSYSLAVDLLVVAMPAATYLWWEVSSSAAAATAPLVLGPVALALGLTRRWQAAVWSALACAACLAHALATVLPLARHWELILGGAVVLGGALLAERALRRPRAGITSRAGGGDGGLSDLLQAGVAGQLAPSDPAPADRIEGGGGDFGGGGATGRF